MAAAAFRPEADGFFEAGQLAEAISPGAEQQHQAIEAGLFHFAGQLEGVASWVKVVVLDDWFGISSVEGVGAAIAEAYFFILQFLEDWPELVSDLRVDGEVIASWRCRWRVECGGCVQEGDAEQGQVESGASDGYGCFFGGSYCYSGIMSKSDAIFDNSFLG